MADSQIIYRVAAHLSSKGDLAASMRSSAAAIGGFSTKFSAATARAAEFGRANTSAVVSSAAAIGKYSAAIAGLGAGGGVAMLVTKGAEFNVTMERAQNTIAGTLQMFNHSAGATDQLGTNVKVAAAALNDLNRIADASPGEFKDIQTLFTSLLPGARAATGEMQRIMNLTQQAAVLQPTFGTDFGTVGSQLGRALTGSAGAEMEVFQKTRALLLEAGQTMDSVTGQGKIFSKNMTNAFAEDFTKKFNQLDIGDRLNLFEKVMGKGSELTKLYEESWEGASSSFVSGWRKIAGRFTQPMFLSMKAALVKAAKDPNSFFGKNNQAKLASAASIMGGIINITFVKGLNLFMKGIDYLANNWEKIAQVGYDVLQVGAGLIKAAFAFGVARMITGAAVLAAATAGRGAMAVGRGARAGGKLLGAGVDGMDRAAGAFKKLMGAFSGNSSPISTVLGLATGIARIGMLAAVAVPLLLVAGAAFGLLSVGLVAVAGVAAYLASKWDELSASVVKGFQDGTVTLKPLIAAGLLLWLRLRKLGESFLGGQEGASMFQTAINLAATAVNAVSDGVARLAEIAAGFLRMIANASDAFSTITDPLGHVRAAEQSAAFNAVSARAAELGYDPQAMRADKELARLENYAKSFDYTISDRLNELAGTIENASGNWKAIGLKDLNMDSVEDLTKRAQAGVADLLAGDDKNKKNTKGANVNIGTNIQNIDLRGEDPDRAMVAWVEPIARLARTPGGSSFDIGGFG